MKNLPESERPRERLLSNGAGTLSAAELLAIIIKTGSKEDSAIGLANRLLSKTTKGIEDIADMSIEELKEVKGIGDAKAAQIIASLELGRRANSARFKKMKITNPTDLSDYFINEMAYLKREYFNIVMLDNKNFIIEIHTVSIGSLNSTIVHPREVYKNAIRRSSASIILVHNHPSGDTNPSKEDIAITERLVECGNILGIKVLDHIIVGENGYFSFKEQNLI
ncbi:MAG: DNA repair protein RadC [Andreesenia angusta]|nr:DNA repair protein RadC [Andreesenia angusta]